MPSEGLKILEVGTGNHPVPPPGYGGAERVIFSLAKALGESGARVIVADFHRSLRSEVIHADGVTIHRLPQPFHLGGTMNRGAMFLYAALSALSLLATLLRRKRLSLRRSTVIHVHTWPHLILLWLARRLGWPGTKVPLVFTLHSPRWMAPERMRRWEYAIGYMTDLLAVKLADLVTFESPILQQKIKRLTGVNQSKSIVLYNGVDTAILDPALYSEQPDGNVVLYAARLSEQKNQLAVVTAMKKVVDENPRVRLILLGGAESKEYLNRLHDRINELNLHEHVRMVSPVHFPELNRLRAKCGIHLVFSQYTGFDVALGETLAFGRALIASRIPTLDGLVTHGIHALLVDPHDTASLADAILELSNNPDLRDRLGRNARKLARERLEWRVLAETLIKRIKLSLQAER